MIAAALLLLCSSPQLSPAEALANVRRAVHYDAATKLAQGLTTSGTAVFCGEKSQYGLLFNVNSGEFIETITGPISQTAAFDGTKAWEADWSGAPRTLSLEERYSTLMSTWMQTHYWLNPKAPLAISPDPTGTSPQLLSLKVHLKDTAFEATVGIDRKTWLPLRMEYTGSDGKTVLTLGDYRKSSGVMIAYDVAQTALGQKNHYTLTAAVPAPTFIRNPYAVLPWSAPDTTFDPAQPATVEMKRAFTGHILIHPKVDGKDLGWFILDSGAGSNVIDKSVADDEKMLSVGSIPAIGIGPDAQTAHFRKATSITLGQMTVAHPFFVALDLKALSNVFGVKLSGIVGYDLFRRSVITVDLKGKSVLVEDPKTFTLATGNWVPLLLSNSHPIVAGKFEGDREGLFRLDTGANGTVTFNGPATENLKLLDGRDTKDIQLGGVGGMEKAKVGTIEYFELAGHRFDKPRVTFALSKTGPLGDKTLTGNLGQDFIEPFTVVFDYAHERIAFVTKAGL